MELNNRNYKRLKALIVFTVIMTVVGFNYLAVWNVIGNMFGIMLPFLLGTAIAFVINVPMKGIEEKLKVVKNSKIRRVISLIAALTLIFGVVIVVMVVVVPELITTIGILQHQVPLFFQEVEVYLIDIFATYPEITSFIEEIDIDFGAIMQQAIEFLRNGAISMFYSTISTAKSVLSGFASFGIGMIFSVYILLQKETLGVHLSKVMEAYLTKEMNTRIKHIASLANKIFSSFIAGQCLEAIILGTMFFVVLSIVKIPYALLVGVLIAFTALIPVFGAIIGMVIGAFLILIMDPSKVLWFIIIFFALQQIEGNFIYPFVVGGSVGLPSIWVLVAVTVGGSTMGIVGMLIFIPLASVVYALIREDVYAKLQMKNPPVKPKEEKE